MWQDNDNDSILSLAIESGSANVFNAVMACVDQDLSPSEVRNVCMIESTIENAGIKWIFALE